MFVRTSRLPRLGLRTLLLAVVRPGAIGVLLCAASASASAGEPAKTLTLEMNGGAGDIELVFIPPGNFRMGRDVGLAEQFGPNRLGSDERPVRKVTIKRGYYIAKYKTTCAEFCQFLRGQHEPDKLVALNEFSRVEKVDGRIGPKPGCGDSAVNVVHWDGAAAYCRWLSGETGHDVRLPTEAQWEFAARGPTSRLYPWGDEPNTDAIPPRRANQDEPQLRCEPVDAYPANATPEGVVGMVGLGGEWCQDYYGAEYLAGDTIDPQGPALEDLPVEPSNPLLAAAEGRWRVLRGCDLAPTKPLATVRAPGLTADQAGVYGIRIVVIPPVD
jgi:formylglycine-generating enzyme required for sulfatase activity